MPIPFEEPPCISLYCCLDASVAVQLEELVPAESVMAAHQMQQPKRECHHLDRWESLAKKARWRLCTFHSGSARASRRQEERPCVDQMVLVGFVRVILVVDPHIT